MLIEESYDDTTNWSVALSHQEWVALVCEQVIKQTNIEDLKLLPFATHFDLVQALYKFLSLLELTINGKTEEADKETQHKIAKKVSFVFIAPTSSIFCQQLKDQCKRKLQAAMKALNECKAQDKANQDVEMAIENEKEHQIQTANLINKAIEKRMRPVLSKLQSIKAISAKNSSGRPRAQLSLPNASGNSKGKSSKTSSAKSSNSVKQQHQQQQSKKEPKKKNPSSTKTKTSAKAIAPNNKGKRSSQSGSNTGKKQRK